MSLSPQFLDELRTRTLLSALIGKTTKLQKAGREFKGCCPFHNEKTPSFYVNDDKAFYHCFGCGAHGDAIRWLTDQRGLPFIDAVKELAATAGMEMPAPDPRAAERAERAKGLHEASADAAEWFAQQLNGIAGAEARSVLERRGISAATAKTFNLGYAPDSRGRLKTALKDYGDPLLVEAGLLIEVEGKEPYDRFRGRLMIPIRDPRGRTIAFGGRVIGDGEPKYLNSPETPLFDKGRTLYNLDRAAPASRKANRILVVEGYMDVIALAQAGIEEAVAPLGTALTEGQLERLWRLSDVPILCFDGDAAGQKAAIRAAGRALPMLTPGRSLAFVTLPTGQDPDDIVQAGGAAAVEGLLHKAVPLIDQIWRIALAGAAVDTPDGRALLKQNLEQTAEQIQHGDLQYQYRRELLKRYFDLFGIKRNNAEKIARAVAEANRHAGRGLAYSLNRAILLGLMRHPNVLKDVVEQLSPLHMNDRYLEEWKGELIKAALDYPVLSESLVDQIMAQTSVHPIDARRYDKDLAFSFYRRSADPSVAETDLKMVIDVLFTEQETRVAFELAKATFQSDMTEQHFQSQIRLQNEFDTARRRVADWLDQVDEAA